MKALILICALVAFSNAMICNKTGDFNVMVLGFIQGAETNASTGNSMCWKYYQQGVLTSLDNMFNGWMNFTTYYMPWDFLTAVQNTTIVIDALSTESKYCQIGQLNAIMDNMLDSGL